jgi:hypothetical protein
VVNSEVEKYCTKKRVSVHNFCTWRLLDHRGFGPAYPCFYLSVCFRGIAAHGDCWIIKSASGECHGCQVMGTSNGCSSLYGDENLLRDLWPVAAAPKVGATGEVQSRTLQRENLMFGLNWLCWQWPCWRYCFVSADFYPGWKPKIYNRATTTLVYCFLLGFWRSWISNVVLVVVVLLYGINHCSRILLLLQFFFFCASVLPLETCQLLDINIYSL